MRLGALRPWFIAAGGDRIVRPDGTTEPRREGLGIAFDCPCGCGNLVLLGFVNPIDGGPIYNVKWNRWVRSGVNCDNLTMSPSIRTPALGCKWHGYIKDGGVVRA